MTAPASRGGAVAVIDHGKTSVRVLILDRGGRATALRPGRIPCGPDRPGGITTSGA